MHCGSSRRERDERDPSNASDGFENDGQYHSEQRPPTSSLLPCPSKSHRDEGTARDHSTTKMGFPPSTTRKKDCLDHERGVGCSRIIPLFVVVGVILLLSAIISIEVTKDRSGSSSSGYNFTISREDFDVHNSSLFPLAQHGFQSQERRYLQNSTDPDVNMDNSTEDPFFDPSLIPVLPITNAPSHSPSKSFQPSQEPTLTPQPTFSSMPPTEESTDTTDSRASSVPSASPQPTHVPSVSFHPTLSLSPTATFEPSPSPTLLTQNFPKYNNKMILENVPNELDDDKLGRIWQNITSRHIMNYYQKVDREYPTHWLFNLNSVRTRKSRIEADGPGGRPDRLTITYDQWLYFESEEEDPGIDQLFELPFASDSFEYSVNLTHAMNWSSLIIVKFDPGESEKSQSQDGLSRLQSILVSVAIVVGSCLIVLFLLWERKQKEENVNAAVNLRSFDNSAVEGMQMPPGPSQWNPTSLSNRSANDTVEITMATSLRSAPGNLRRNTIEGQRLSSMDIAALPTHSRASSNSSNIENSSSNQENSPKPNSVEVNYGSPDIPKQVPISIRGNSNSERSAVSTTSTIRSVSNRPFLPPLPPPSSNSSTSHERRRTADSLESASVSEHVPLNDYSINATGRPAFRRPSGRTVGLRFSNDDNVSELTHAFPSNSGYFSSEDSLLPNSYANGDPKYVNDQPKQRIRDFSFSSINGWNRRSFSARGIVSHLTLFSRSFLFTLSFPVFWQLNLDSRGSLNWRHHLRLPCIYPARKR